MLNHPYVGKKNHYVTVDQSGSQNPQLVFWQNMGHWQMGVGDGTAEVAAGHTNAVTEALTSFVPVSVWLPEVQCKF